MSNIKNYKCVFCKKNLKTFSNSTCILNRKTHRSCWLKNRSYEERHLDYLFTERDNKDKILKCSQFNVIHPISNECPVLHQNQ